MPSQSHRTCRLTIRSRTCPIESPRHRRVQGLRRPSYPAGRDISSQLSYPQERGQKTEIAWTVVASQARLAPSHRDETTPATQHRPFRGIQACFFNLDVLLCFCILHSPPLATAATTVDSLPFPPSSHPLIALLPKQGGSVRGCGCYQRSSYLNL